jgi:hypothetical protein
VCGHEEFWLAMGRVRALNGKWAELVEWPVGYDLPVWRLYLSSFSW